MAKTKIIQKEQNKKEYNFKNLKSFYLYIIKTNDDLNKNFYKKVYENLKGKLKPKNKTIILNKNNKLLDYISRNNILFIKSGILKNRSIIKNKTELKQYFKNKNNTQYENEFLYNSFIEFINLYPEIIKEKTIIKNVVDKFCNVFYKNNFKNKNQIYMDLKKVFGINFIKSFINFNNLEYLKQYSNISIRPKQKQNKTNVLYSDIEYKELVYLTEKEYKQKLNNYKKIIDNKYFIK